MLWSSLQQLEKNKNEIHEFGIGLPVDSPDLAEDGKAKSVPSTVASKGEEIFDTTPAKITATDGEVIDPAVDLAVAPLSVIGKDEILGRIGSSETYIVVDKKFGVTEEWTGLQR